MREIYGISPFGGKAGYRPCVLLTTRSHEHDKGGSSWEEWQRHCIFQILWKVQLLVLGRVFAHSYSQNAATCPSLFSFLSRKEPQPESGEEWTWCTLNANFGNASLRKGRRKTDSFWFRGNKERILYIELFLNVF